MPANGGRGFDSNPTGTSCRQGFEHITEEGFRRRPGRFQSRASSSIRKCAGLQRARLCQNAEGRFGGGYGGLRPRGEILDPHNVEFLFARELRLVTADLNDLDGAISDYNRAAQSLDPTNTRIFNNRGTVKGDEGDAEGAISDYNRVIEFDPKDALCLPNRGRRPARGQRSFWRDGGFEPGVGARPTLCGLFLPRRVKEDEGDPDGDGGL